ncbi:MAG: Lrp/AsnC ligand binding domain-containing protein [Chitinophagales bacterium]
MDANYQIDNTDLQIISLLVEDGNIPYTEIAKKIFVSSGTVHVRMKKLEEMGVVKKMQLMVDYHKLGYDITTFLGLFLSRSAMYKDVVAALEAIPEVVACHYTTGTYSLFLKVLCKDTKHLYELLHNKIQKIEGIQRTETLISLEESFERPLQLPV